MTGAYVRIQRDGKWENIEFDQLTDEEMEGFAQSQSGFDGWRWAKFLAKWIRDNIIEADIDVSHSG